MGSLHLQAFIPYLTYPLSVLLNKCREEIHLTIYKPCDPISVFYTSSCLFDQPCFIVHPYLASELSLNSECLTVSEDKMLVTHKSSPDYDKY